MVNVSAPPALALYLHCRSHLRVPIRVFIYHPRFTALSNQLNFAPCLELSLYPNSPSGLSQRIISNRAQHIDGTAAGKGKGGMSIEDSRIYREFSTKLIPFKDIFPQNP